MQESSIEPQDTNKQALDCLENKYHANFTRYSPQRKQKTNKKRMFGKTNL